MFIDSYTLLVLCFFGGCLCGWIVSEQEREKKNKRDLK